MDNLNANVITNIITLVGTLGGTLIGGVTTFLINEKLEQKKFQRDIYFSNKEKIDLAYKDIYDHLLNLKKYYQLFIEFGNEYKESEDYKKFAPLNNITSVMDCIARNELYLNNEFLKKYEEELFDTIRSHPSLALQLAINPELFSESDVEAISNTAIEKIQNFMNFIKKRFEEKV